MKKIQLSDITDDQFSEARRIVHSIIASQSTPANTLGYLALRKILNKCWEYCSSLNARLNARLNVELNAGLNDELDAGLDAGLNDRLIAGLSTGLDAGLIAGLSAGLKSRLKYCYCGIFWSWWLCRYLIAQSFGCKFDKEKLFLLREFCMLSPIIAQDKKTKMPVIMPKPSVIRWNVAGKTKEPFAFPIYELHSNGKPSVEYYNLFNLYHWHNKKIPERMGITHSNNWNPKWLLDEQNAEVRRILVNELGLDRVLHTLGGKPIHDACITLRTSEKTQWQCHYRLVELEYANNQKRRALVMDNASIPDTRHVEYVPLDCNTVDQAMNFRLGRSEDDIDDVNGQDWLLHGDVIIKPKGCKKQKRWPKMIA